LSSEAAQWVAPGEYDRLVGSLGAKGTNAYTWVEQTVYVNDIPSNELARWMELEAERFRMMALRLFHTELETVYEEFNISQDKDYRKANQAIREILFPNHPYGRQTTIGKGEHLKNPSQVKIQEFFRNYYIPNNMGIILCGEFDPDQAVQLAEEHFGHFKTRKRPDFSFDPQTSLRGPVEREVYGQEAPFVDIAWRLRGSDTDDPLMIALLKGLLYNDQAGLIDLQLIQEQRLLEADAWSWVYEDYSAIGLFGRGRKGQPLKEVAALLLEQVEALKDGRFDDWLLEAVINNMKLTDLKAGESNKMRAAALTNYFILGMDWSRFGGRYQWLESIDKKKIREFAAEHLNDDYALIYKRKGEDPDVVRVEKPPITPVSVKRQEISQFARTFLSRPSPNLEPSFVDFEEAIERTKLRSGVPLEYVYNPVGSYFHLHFIFEMGKLSDPHWPLALIYLPYLGTSRYSPAELKQAFYRHGLNFNCQTGDRRIRISVSGLESSLEEGLQLWKHLIEEVQPQQSILENVVSDILEKRANAKQDRNLILRQALASYARYGPRSPFTFRLSGEQLLRLQAPELTDRIKALPGYDHHIYYYGSKPAEEVASLLDRYHPAKNERKAVTPPRPMEERSTADGQVFFLDFPIVQSDLMLLSRGTPRFSLEEHELRDWYNDYFGFGLSSVVFQEIRESRALAYSTYAYYSSPSKEERSHYLQAYVGTQPDKLAEAVGAMRSILEDMPVSLEQIEQSRRNILRRIETDRIAPPRIYWVAQATRDLGYQTDLRENIYRRLKYAEPQMLIDFHRDHIRQRSYDYVIMGRKEAIDRKLLESLGQVRELSMEEIFGY
ncbi:MAG: insulinase family protein, partial [Saprospiraceae bacterium]|nr:insulinase family protein [Saprospiraceae bacterium]